MYLDFSSSFSCSARSIEADCTAAAALGATAAWGVPLEEGWLDPAAPLAVLRGDETAREAGFCRASVGCRTIGDTAMVGGVGGRSPDASTGSVRIGLCCWVLCSGGVRFGGLCKFCRLAVAVAVGCEREREAEDVGMLGSLAQRGEMLVSCTSSRAPRQTSPALVAMRLRLTARSA